MSTDFCVAVLPRHFMDDNSRPIKTFRTGQSEEIDGDETVNESDDSKILFTSVMANHSQIKLFYTVST